MNDIIRKIIHWVSCPTYAANQLLYRVSPLFGDETYIRIKFLLLNKYRLNLDSPKTFNEKLNWLKLYDRKVQYTLLADKYEVKQIVSKIIGEEYVVPCYAVWNSVEDVDLSSLPQKFVLKTTHDSSGVIVCKDKNNFSFLDIKDELAKNLKSSHYLLSREWVYKNITPRIIAEEFLDDGSGRELRDYKFLCFNGEPRLMYITNKGLDIFENFYDLNFNPVNLNHGFKRAHPEFKKPLQFDKMVELARKLSQGIPFVRVDFYSIFDKIYFGEFTFYDWSGFRKFADPYWDNLLGDWIKLP